MARKEASAGDRAVGQSPRRGRGECLERHAVAHGTGPQALVGLVGAVQLDSPQPRCEGLAQHVLEEELAWREAGVGRVVARLDEVQDAVLLQCQHGGEGPSVEPQDGDAQSVAPSRPAGDPAVERA